MTTNYGAQPRRGEQVWESAAHDSTAGEFEPEGRLTVDLGYGLSAFEGAGLVTPYGGLRLSDAGQDYRLGARLETGSGLSMSLDGQRRHSTSGTVEHELRLEGRLRL